MNISLDNIIMSASEGETILEVAERNGIRIPALCNYPGFGNGVCRLCMVETENGKMVPACSTKTTPGLSVKTESQSLRKYRKTLLTLYMKTHGEHEGLADLKCRLHEYAREYGVDTDIGMREPGMEDLSHPGIAYYPGLCIQCRKCVTACDEDQVNEVISLVGRGHEVAIGFDDNLPMGSSSCTSCGACVDACPTGALIEKDWTSAERTVVTTCPYCAVGCQVEYGLKGRKITWARGIKGLGINDGKLCVKGKFGYEFETSRERLTKPLIRRSGFRKEPLAGRQIEEVFRESTWEEAMSLLATRIKKTVERHGNDSVAGIASDRSTNEDIYAFQKLMRAVVKTDNLDQSATLCHSPSAAMLSWGLGAGASTNPVHDVFNSGTIMVVGSNTDRAHPVLSSYIKRAAREGAFLIVVDPRRVELAEKADMFLQIKPGTDVYLFTAMAKYIIDSGLADTDYIGNYSEGFDSFRISLEEFSMDEAEEITGIPAAAIERAARSYAENGPSSIFWTLGITEHVNGSDNVSSLVNLAIITGNIGKQGSGLNPIRGQNNVQGGADVGGFPGSLPGYQDLVDPVIRTKFENAWGTNIPPMPGLKNTEMVEEALKGNVKLMYISGENSVRSHPDSSNAMKALQGLEFLAVQDLFMTETAELADVVLPVASSFEQYGTFTNTERRVQLVRKLFEPPGDAKPDWQVYSDLASRLGYNLGFRSSTDIMYEMSGLMPSWKGISHERLEKGGLQWPVSSGKSAGTEILHVQGAMRGKSRLRPLTWKGISTGGYPYVLITGREREHYHTGTMTSRSRVISAVERGPAVEMNSLDMENEGVRDGDTVLLESGTGQIEVNVRSAGNLPPGVMFTTFHYPGLKSNILTGTVLDPITKTPAYKDTRVRIQKIDRVR